MKIKNISNKIIGLGTMSVLPEETQEVPIQFERHPSLQTYIDMKLFEVVEGSKQPVHIEREEIIIEHHNEPSIERSEVTEESEDDIKNLRKAQLAALKSMSNEDVGKLAKELGINPASCKDQADVKKKVRSILQSQSK